MLKEEVLELLQSCCIFDGILTEYDFEDKITEKLFDSDVKFESFFGATKLVLIFENTDFVVKIPFTGEYYMYAENDDDKYQPFTCAGELAEEEWDYCKIEESRFYDAENEGLGICFAKTECIGRINDFPIYVQPKAEIFSYLTKEYSEEKKSSTREKCSEIDADCFNSGWLSDVLDYYGEDIFTKLVKFISDNNYNDLHGSNLGYVGNRPVLVDYCGYAD